MTEPRLTLSELPGQYAVARLEPDAPRPDWAAGGSFTSITRTPAELSVVCAAECVPPEVVAERDWRCLMVAGPLDFSLIGILAALTTALARAGVSVFAISTYDTDYLLVRDAAFELAVEALTEAGNRVEMTASDPVI